jgi:hypothetical protein
VSLSLLQTHIVAIATFKEQLRRVKLNMPFQGCVVCSIQYSWPFTSLREALSRRSSRASVKSVILAAKHECKACSIILTGFSKINPDWAQSPWAEIILATSSFPSLRLKGSDSGNDELSPDFYVHNPEILNLLEGL